MQQMGGMVGDHVAKGGRKGKAKADARQWRVCTLASGPLLLWTRGTQQVRERRGRSEFCPVVPKVTEVVICTCSLKDQFLHVPDSVTLRNHWGSMGGLGCFRLSTKQLLAALFRCRSSDLLYKSLGKWLWCRRKAGYRRNAGSSSMGLSMKLCRCDQTRFQKICRRPPQQSHNAASWR